MITVLETTAWDSNVPNHKYIMSDNMRWAYGYFRHSDKYPQLFSKPINIDWRGRTYKVLSKTKDVIETNRSWSITGSKNNVYTVTEEENQFRCTCPAALYRHTECKHIQQVKQELSLGQNAINRGRVR